MKKIRLLLILVILFAFVPTTFAQLNTANKLFNLYRFDEAIPYYLKATEKETDPKLQAQAIVRLADCYRLTHNADMAGIWYSNAVSLGNIDPVNYLYFGQALQNKGNYLKAKAVFLKYSELVPADPRGKAYAEACDMPDKWENISHSFEIQNIASLNSEWSDFGPAYYKDGLVFTSDRRENFLDNTASGSASNNYFKMYFAKQVNPKNPFSEMEVIKSFSKSFNQPYHNGPASFSPDFGIIYLTRSYNDRTMAKNKIKNHLLKIFYAKIKGKNWSKEKPFYLNSKEFSVAHPSIGPDGKTIFFSSDMKGGYGASDIWYCRWENTKWSAPVNLGSNVNTFGNEVFPFILNDSTLYFASNGLPGYGGLDVFVTQKKDGNWQTPRNIQKPVNSSYDDFSFILDASGTHGFFSSNRQEGLGSDDIYACKRLTVLPEVKPAVIPKSKSFFISGYVKDENSLKPVEDATVYLLNTKTGKVKILRTNADGFYRSAIDQSAGYLAKATKLNYLPDCYSYIPDSTNSYMWMKAPRDLLLEKLEVNKVFKLENFYFDFDKWNIRPDAAPALDKLVSLMMQNPISVELGSHTDCHGTFLENDILSQKRAESAVRYMIQKGVNKDRITARGYGERKLTNKCTDGVDCSPAEHQANRRTEYKITAVSPTLLPNNPKPANFREGSEIDQSLLSPDFFDDCPFE